MSDKLKPCPFCGNTIIITRTGEGHTCNRCGSVGYWDWNTRPIEDELRSQLAAANATIARYRAALAKIAEFKKCSGPGCYFCDNEDERGHPYSVEAILAQQALSGKEVAK